MKLEIGIPDYPFEREIMSATLRGRLPHKPVPLYLTTIAEMESLHERLPNVRATPAYIAFDPVKKRVWLHPLPSGEFHLDIVPDESPEPSIPVATAAPPVPAPVVQVETVATVTAAPAPEQPGRFAGKITRAVAEAFGKKL